MTESYGSPSNITPFSPLNLPRIYAYSDRHFPGCLKVGFTTRQSALERVREQYPVKTPEQTWAIELDELALRDDGSHFTDHDVHRVLRQHGIRHVNGEWFECGLDHVRAALLEVKSGKRNEEKRTLSFGMRPEQADAVAKTAAYFESFKADSHNQGRSIAAGQCGQVGAEAPGFSNRKNRRMLRRRSLVRWRIAACVGGGQSGCTCYSDQATPLAEVTDAMCREYVKHGIPFNPYKDTQPVQTAAYSQPADTPATTLPAK